MLWPETNKGPSRGHQPLETCMLNLSATLIAFLSFVAVVLFICVMAYRNADRLEAFLERKFRKKAPRQSGGHK